LHTRQSPTRVDGQHRYGHMGLTLDDIKAITPDPFFAQCLCELVQVDKHSACHIHQHGIFLHLAVKICIDNVLPPRRMSSPPGTSTKSMSLPRASWSSFACWTEHRLCCAVRDSSSTVLCGELRLDVYMQCMRPKEMRHFSVAWAMRPKLGNLLCGC
jgi:hypothetical protein